MLYSTMCFFETLSCNFDIRYCLIEQKGCRLDVFSRLVSFTGDLWRVTLFTGEGEGGQIGVRAEPVYVTCQFAGMWQAGGPRLPDVSDFSVSSDPGYIPARRGPYPRAWDADRAASAPETHDRCPGFDSCTGLFCLGGVSPRPDSSHVHPARRELSDFTIRGAPSAFLDGVNDLLHNGLVSSLIPWRAQLRNLSRPIIITLTRTRAAGTALIWHRANVADVGPALNQRCTWVSNWLSTGLTRSNLSSNMIRVKRYRD